jgi:peptide-methionine (S)-S-oxide reductase
MSKNLQTATLGAGCFWCVEAVFQRLKGVESVISGYTGGKKPAPTYAEICTGRTGHAEVIQIGFDPAQVSFADLLEVFWHTHDPTTLNQQGNDVGTQYRSAIFYADAAQKSVAEASLAKTEASGLWPKPIVTEIVPLTVFYPAEDYHQNYFNQNPNQPYCSFAIPPKLRKLEQKFGDRLKPA